MDKQEELAKLIRNANVQMDNDSAVIEVIYEDIGLDGYFREYQEEIQAALSSQLLIDMDQDTWFYHDGMMYRVEFWVKPNLEEQEILRQEYNI